MRFKIVLILIFLCSVKLNAQQNIQQDPVIKDIVESLAENLPEDYDLSELIDQLTIYHKHPIDLNKTTTEELKSLVFLSPLQISNFFSHIKENGKLLDILELQTIDGFDLQTIQRILLFATLNAPTEYEKLTLKNLINLSDNDLIIRYGQGIEQQKGYTDLPGSKYLGAPTRFLTRYRYNFGSIITAALTFEKDAGEKFIGGSKQYPFDYISGNISLSKLGKVKKLIVGDYAMQFGQGLTLWTGFAFSKGADITSAARKDVGLRPYTSSNEYSYFRGASTTVNLVKNIDFTPFLSFRKLDAGLSTNANSEQVLSSINQSGYHRTQAEIDNKNRLSQKIYGGVFQYNNNNLTVGVIAYQTEYNHAFVPSSQLYDKYGFAGKNLTNLGLHYNYTFQNIYFYGEAAKSLNGGFAYVNGALISLSPTMAAVITHRNYDKNYQNFFNQGISENSEAINENGLYTGLNITPNKKLAFSMYGDYFKFPWLKYRVDAPSSGYEILCQTTYTPSKKLKFLLRFKTEYKQQNTDLTTSINYLDNVKRENYRADVSWKLNKYFNLQNRLEVSQYKKGDVRAEFGLVIYQDLDYSPLSSKLSANMRLAYFNTPSYNSRIYAYEDDVLYGFSTGLYNGKGFRSYLNLKYNIRKRLDVWAKYAVYAYAGGPKIVGSGLDEINGNKKSDVKLQLRYQF